MNPRKLSADRSPKNSGYDPAKALLLFSARLTEYEIVEIATVKSVYFTGKEGITKFTDRFCSKKGLYRGLAGDHIKYRYEIIRELGRGSFGIVFHCWDHKKSEEVAIKIIKNKPKYREAGNFESILLDQIKKVDNFDSNCIVTKLKGFQFRGHLCIVFELLHCTLSHFLSETSPVGIENTLVKRITIQLLQGLKFLHSLNYIHCDLKPENIMMKFANKSKIKIIDLGSACYNYTRSVPKYIQTRYYRAPEIIMGVLYGPSIDMWSLGCVIIELLLGYPIFQVGTEEELLYSMINLIGVPEASFIDRGSKSQDFFEGTQVKYPERIEFRGIDQMLASFNKSCIDFVKQCLVWDPELRITADRGLGHCWINPLRKRLK